MVKKIIVKLEDQAEDFIKNYMKGLPRNFLPSSTEFIKSSNSYEEKKKKVTKKEVFHSLLRLGRKEVPK